MRIRAKEASLEKLTYLLGFCLAILGALGILAQAQSKTSFSGLPTSTSADSRSTAASPQSSGAGQTASPGTRPVTGSAGGFQQLAIDRLASDFIQDRYYIFKEAGGLWMPYSIFVPRNYDKSKKYPLIVMLHGLNITAVQQIRFEGVAEQAEKFGYIVVCPTGYSVRSFWGMPSVGRGLLEGEPGFENEKNLKLSVQELAYADTGTCSIWCVRNSTLTRTAFS